MGATIQKTRFSSKTKRILTDESPNLSAGSDIQVISGTDILTNNQVGLNIPTSASTSLTSMPAGQLILVNYYRSILRFPCIGLVPLLTISIWNSWTLDIYFGLSEHYSTLLSSLSSMEMSSLFCYYLSIDQCSRGHQSSEKFSKISMAVVCHALPPFNQSRWVCRSNYRTNPH